MASEVRTNKLSPATGTAFTLGDSGDTFTVPSGATLAVASGATISNAGTQSGFGKVLQVVSTTKTDAYSTTAGQSVWSKIGLGTNDLEVSITPSSASNKVIVICTVAVYQATGGIAKEWSMFSIFRDSTNLSNPDSPGNRTASLGGTNQDSINLDRGFISLPMQFLDSPSTTSSVTYSAQVYRATTGTLYINRSSADADADSTGRGVSSIIAMEIAA